MLEWASSPGVVLRMQPTPNNSERHIKWERKMIFCKMGMKGNSGHFYSCTQSRRLANAPPKYVWRIVRDVRL